MCFCRLLIVSLASRRRLYRRPISRSAGSALFDVWGAVEGGYGGCGCGGVWGEQNGSVLSAICRRRRPGAAPPNFLLRRISPVWMARNTRTRVHLNSVPLFQQLRQSAAAQEKFARASSARFHLHWFCRFARVSRARRAALLRSPQHLSRLRVRCSPGTQASSIPFICWLTKTAK